MIRLDTSDLMRLNRDLAAAQAKVPVRARQAVAKSAVVAEQYANANIPVDTGETRSKIYVKLNGLTAEVGSPTRGARYQETGTSRHRAQPTFTPAGELAAEALGEGLQEAGAPW